MSELKDMKARYKRRGSALPRLADRKPEPAHDLITIAEVRTDGGTQPRESMDMGLVEDYAARMSWDEARGLVLDPEEQPWPAVTVFDDGSERWLADGFHRLHAAKKAGIERMQVVLTKGSLEEAILHSLGANASHGKRRTQADIKRGVERVLSHKEWGRRSNSWLGEICKVSAKTIKRHRERLELAREIPFHTSLESTNAAYNERTPPFELDESGYLILPDDRSRAPSTRRQKTPPDEDTMRASGSSFVPEDLDSAQVVLAFPTSAMDCAELGEAFSNSPSLVVIPINSNTPLAYEAARALKRLVDELGMTGPRPLWIASHRRHYFIWSNGDIELSGSIEDADLLTRGRRTIMCGEPLGGW